MGNLWQTEELNRISLSEHRIIDVGLNAKFYNLDFFSHVVSFICWYFAHNRIWVYVCYFVGNYIRISWTTSCQYFPRFPWNIIIRLTLFYYPSLPRLRWTMDVHSRNRLYKVGLVLFNREYSYGFYYLFQWNILKAMNASNVCNCNFLRKDSMKKSWVNQFYLFMRVHIVILIRDFMFNLRNLLVLK